MVSDAVAERVGRGVIEQNRRIYQAEHRREILRERTGMEANQIAMKVAHIVSAAINTNNKGLRRRLKAEAVKLIEAV